MQKKIQQKNAANIQKMQKIQKNAEIFKNMLNNAERCRKIKNSA